jgi:predicted AAA+ superfamily ATPase
MHRDIENNLSFWADSGSRMPLLLRGARQVGKTYLIEKFGQARFQEVVTINFELEPEFATCFNSLDPRNILR